jgi:putative permease
MNTENELSYLPFLKNAVKRILPNSQAVALAAILLGGYLLVYFSADFMMPVFASVVLAYLLEGLIAKAEGKKLPRLPAVLVVFSGFMGFLVFLLFILMPILYEQAVQLLQQIPEMLSIAQRHIMRLPEMYPKFVSAKNIREIMFAVQNELIRYSQEVVSVSAASLVGLITGLLYLILMPVLIFFLLKDKEHILAWVMQFLPKDRHLSLRVWEEMDIQLGNYVRGKFLEVFILWGASYVTFAMMSLNYAMLLAVLMGLQVIIPYVGATLVTFPVLGVAYFQWGTTDPFMYVFIAYAIIQTIDGVVLVPLLFSEAVNLHPVAIIVAILFFGGLWGFWGVFFAIPLATLVKSVITAWPRIGDTIRTNCL